MTTNAGDERFRDLPPPGPFSPDAVIRDLGNGLVMRWGSLADIEALAAFTAVGQADPPDYEPDRYLPNWVPELMGVGHPDLPTADFILVEDTKRRRIASSLCLIPQRCSFGGVAMTAGQPELVATHPAFRRRGLVRLQLLEVQRASEERGDLFQLIHGIPWYYRQFGYELGLEIGGSRVGPSGDVPLLPHPIAANLDVRAARGADLPFVAELYERVRERDLVFCERDAADWRSLFTRNPRSFARRELHIVERRGQPIAACSVYPVLIGGGVWVDWFEVADPLDWPAASERLLCAVRRVGEAYAERDGGALATVRFMLGSAHPCYPFVRSRTPQEVAPHALYVRVPDLEAFLSKAAPVFEARLLRSVFSGYTGALALSFYRSGVRLRFEKGRMTGVEPWIPSTEESGDAAFPDLTFLKLLFGYRTLGQLREAFPDCEVNGDLPAALLEVLFPRAPSNLWLTR